MPADVNAFSKCALDEPTDCIRTRISGPRPAKNGEPSSVPTGTESSFVVTSESFSSTSSMMADCKRLNSAMLLLTAVIFPSLSFSKEMSWS